MTERLLSIASDVLKDTVVNENLTEDSIIETKSSEFSYVTKSDEKINDIIKDKLESRTRYPVLSEEDENNLNCNTYWTVDPIDGTIPFVHGIPTYVSMISLVKSGEPTLSAIYCPGTDNMYTAHDNTAYCNGSRISSSDEDSLIGTPVFCTVIPDEKYDTEKQRQIRSSLTTDTLLFGVFCAGFASVAIASGGATAAVYSSLSVWDYMPTAHLVASSGGVVGTLESKNTGILSLENQESPVCLASSVSIFDEMCERYRNI